MRRGDGSYSSRHVIEQETPSPESQASLENVETRAFVDRLVEENWATDMQQNIKGRAEVRGTTCTWYKSGFESVRRGRLLLLE